MVVVRCLHGMRHWSSLCNYFLLKRLWHCWYIVVDRIVIGVGYMVHAERFGGREMFPGTGVNSS
jgi:hypothetical protein